MSKGGSFFKVRQSSGGKALPLTAAQSIQVISKLVSVTSLG